MKNITRNSLKVVNLLTREYAARFSINEISKQIKLSPRGAYKILKSLEEDNIIYPEKVGNIIHYRMNFDIEKVRKLAEFALLNCETNPYVEIQKKISSTFATVCKISGSIWICD